MYFYPLGSASNFCVWKSFQRGSLKIHLLFIERLSVGDGTIDAQRKIGQDRQGKEHVETEMQVGTRRDETAQSSTPETQMLAAFFSAGAIWICALQPRPSKPQQEVTLSALLPGSSTPSRPLYLLQGLISFPIRSPSSVFLLCAYRPACERDEGYLRSARRHGRFRSLPHPRQLFQRYLDGISSHLLNTCSLMVLESTSKTAEKVEGVWLFHKHISIKTLVAKFQLAPTFRFDNLNQRFGSRVAGGG